MHNQPPGISRAAFIGSNMATDDEIWSEAEVEAAKAEIDRSYKIMSECTAKAKKSLIQKLESMVWAEGDDEAERVALDSVIHLANSAAKHRPYMRIAIVEYIRNLIIKYDLDISSWDDKYPVLGFPITSAQAIGIMSGAQADSGRVASCRSHFISRAEERLSVVYSHHDYSAICNMIKSGRAVYLCDSSSGGEKERYYLNYCGREMFVGYNAQLGLAVTVLLAKDMEGKYDKSLIPRFKVAMYAVPLISMLVNKVLDGIDEAYTEYYAAKEARERKLERKLKGALKGVQLYSEPNK